MLFDLTNSITRRVLKLGCFPVAVCAPLDGQGSVRFSDQIERQANLLDQGKGEVLAPQWFRSEGAQKTCFEAKPLKRKLNVREPRPPFSFSETRWSDSSLCRVVSVLR